MKKILIYGLTFIFEGMGLYALQSSTIRYDFRRLINQPIAGSTIKVVGKKLAGELAGNP